MIMYRWDFVTGLMPWSRQSTGGGVLVIAKDEARARELVLTVAHNGAVLTCRIPGSTQVTTFADMAPSRSMPMGVDALEIIEVFPLSQEVPV